MKHICGFVCVSMFLLLIFGVSVYAAQSEGEGETVYIGGEETFFETETIDANEIDTSFAETEQNQPEKVELPEEIFVRSGMGFSEDASYYPTKPLNAFPNTIEVWLKFPTDYSSRGGVVIGNYGGIKACINFEIYTNGIPRFYCTDSFGNVYDYVFNKVDIRKRAWMNVSVVNNIEANRVECYVNGELIQFIEGAYPQDYAMLTSGFSFGGDLRSGNPQYFKGGISSVAMFSRAKNSSEIIADMKSVDDCDPDLIAHYEVSSADLNCDIADLGMNGYDLSCERRWMESKDDVGDYAYSFCVVGDTQILARYYPDSFHSIYDWILENRYSKKIEYVFGLGDITDANTSAEWALASGQISRLNGVVPYSLVRGNHDGSGPFNQFFNNYAYTSQFNGFYEAGKIDNSWRTFSVCGINYLLLGLDYGPSDAVLAWAGSIIEAHPNHRVIITTHSYLFRDGTTLDMTDVYPPNPSGSNNGKSNNGDQMWDKLVSKYSNIFLVISGHDPSDNIVVTQSYGDNGNLVTQMLIDPQEIDRSQNGVGLVAMLYFSHDGRTVSIEYFSTIRNKFYRDSNQMTISLPAFVPITTAPESTVPETEAEKTPETTVQTDSDEGEVTEQESESCDVDETTEESTLPDVTAEVGIDEESTENNESSERYSDESTEKTDVAENDVTECLESNDFEQSGKKSGGQNVGVFTVVAACCGIALCGAVGCWGFIAKRLKKTNDNKK